MRPPPRCSAEQQQKELSSGVRAEALPRLTAATAVLMVLRWMAGTILIPVTVEVQDSPSDDICYATSNRQAAIKKISPESDLVIVVGSANSSNSVRLKEVALEHGAARAERVDFANQIDEAWFEDARTIGVTSGASVPEVLVDEVLRLLADYGYGEAAEVVTAEEDILFSLPKEIRKALQDAGHEEAPRGGNRATTGK